MLYDPVLHRFLSPDNHIQDPYNTQNYNRYGYVLNNPLKYTDPSGEFYNFLWGAVLGVVTNGFNNLVHSQPFFKGAFKAALIGGVGGYYSNAIGTAVSGMSGIGKIVLQSAMHGHVNGVLGGLDGGSYQQGFLSSAGSSIVSSMVGSLVISNVPGMRGITTVVAGGLSAGIIHKASGGNFWQGFRMGAITAGLNHLGDHLITQIKIQNVKRKILYKFTEGKTPFQITEITFAEFIGNGYGTVEIKAMEGAPNSMFGKKLESSGYSFGAPTGINGELINATKGMIVFDVPMEGYDLRDLFSSTKILNVSSMASGFKLSRITGMDAASNGLWHANSFGLGITLGLSGSRYSVNFEY